MTEFEKVKRPDAMSTCERTDNLELAVIRQLRVRVWMISGEVFEGVAKSLETSGGADMLQLDSQRIDVSQMHSVAFSD